MKTQLVAFSVGGMGAKASSSVRGEGREACWSCGSLRRGRMQESASSQAWAVSTAEPTGLLHQLEWSEGKWGP